MSFLNSGPNLSHLPPYFKNEWLHCCKPPPCCSTQTGGTTTTSVDTASGSPTIEHTGQGLTFSTGSGNDELHVAYNSDGSVVVTYNGQNYHFSAEEARNLIIDAGDGNDTITCSGRPGANNSVVIRGGAGDDTLNGSAGTDILEGGDGNDTISGGRGSDHIDGGAGNDQIHGGRGSDIIRGGSGNDRIDGGKGHDRILGQDGDDSIYGGSGDYDDVIYGGAGDDEIGGGRGNDYLHGGDGNDTIRGGSGSDIVIGGAGADVLSARGWLNQIYQEEMPKAPQPRNSFAWNAAPRPTFLDR